MFSTLFIYKIYPYNFHYSKPASLENLLIQHSDTKNEELPTCEHRINQIPPYPLQQSYQKPPVSSTPEAGKKKIKKIKLEMASASLLASRKEMKSTERGSRSQKGELARTCGGNRLPNLPSFFSERSSYFKKNFSIFLFKKTKVSGSLRSRPPVA